MKRFLNRARRATLAAVIAFAALAAIPMGAARAQPTDKAWLSADDPLTSANRLEQIGQQLRVANAALCRRTTNACEGRLIVSPAHDLNAWADGRNVVVTARMMQFAKSDDELAFVVAHEMAHNLLGHAALLQSSAALFGPHSRLLADRARHLEIDADILAVSLLAEAGFDPRACAPFILRSMRGRKESSSTHPGSLNRLEAIRTAVLHHFAGGLEHADE